MSLSRPDFEPFGPLQDVEQHRQNLQYDNY